MAKLLNINITTVKRWKNHIEKEGSFSSVYDSSNRKAPKVPEDELREYFSVNPDALLKEAAEHFKYTPQAIFYACKRHKLTYKKNSLAIKSVMKSSVKTSTN